MIRRTIHQQIAHNTRASLIYAFLLVLLLGALGGAIAGYYQTNLWPIGFLASAGIGLVIGLVAWTSGPGIVLQISQARQASPLERQVVDNVTEEMAIAAGIPAPQVYMIEDSAPNAFATGNGPKHGIVCVTTGLLQKLNREELQGVIAHELGHIRNNDIKLMTTLAIVAGLIPMISDFFLRSLWWSGGKRRDDRDSGNPIMLVIALVLAILAPIFAKLLELAVSRQREFLADASSAEFTRNPEGLANALLKISHDHEILESANRATQHMYIVNPIKPFEERAQSLLSTHPPIAERVNRLMSLAGVVRTPDLAEPGAKYRA